MDEMQLRLVFGKINCIWSELNVDIDPFVVVLGRESNVVIVKNGNNLAEHRGGSLKKSYARAKRALDGGRIKGGSRIYWKMGRYPDCQRQFLGAIGVSGLRVERDHLFVRKMAGFRSHFWSRDLPIFEGDLKKLIEVDPISFK